MESTCFLQFRGVIFRRECLWQVWILVHELEGLWAHGEVKGEGQSGSMPLFKKGGEEKKKHPSENISVHKQTPQRV